MRRNYDERVMKMGILTWAPTPGRGDPIRARRCSTWQRNMIMKRKALVLLAAAVAVALLAGCSFLFPTVVGSRSLVSSGYGFTGYNRVTASQTFRVSVIADTAYSVQVTCDDNVIDHLIVRQIGTAIELSLDQGFNYVGVTASAVVHMPALAGLDLSGATQAVVDPGFSSTGPLSVSISGASTANLKGIACGPVTVDISGASGVVVVGTASMVRLSVSGASTADLRACVGTGADVSMSGASQAYVNVGSGVLSFAVSGASTLFYTGSPVLQLRDLSGTSRIVKL
jgi:hypothetical protein